MRNKDESVNENNPTEWMGFNYVKFDNMNNYKDEQQKNRNK